MKSMDFLPNESLQVIFNQETSSYYTQLRMKNSTNRRMHYYVPSQQAQVASTFGPYCQFRLKDKMHVQANRVLEAHEQIQLIFKIKPTNQISSDQQKIMVSYGFEEICSYFVVDSSEWKQVFHLKFSEELVEDELITSILKADAQVASEDANILVSKRDYKKALNIYEEAFQLYRPCIQALIGMAQCQFELAMAQCQLELGMIQRAIISIETGLLITKSGELTVWKVKIMLFMLKRGNRCIAGTLKICKDNLQGVLAKQKGMIRINSAESKKLKVYELASALMLEIKSMAEQSQDLIFDEYLYGLKDKVLHNYQSDDPFLKKHFQDRQYLQEFMGQLLKQQIKENTVETPDQVLDPLTYEIMKDPVIVPFGNSYDRNFLVQYLIQQGYRDPFSRKQLRPEHMRPNNTLLRYINEHPDYAKWLMYEMDVSQFK